MAKNKKPAEKPSDDAPSRQINFRAGAKLAAELDDIAETLGVDLSNLVRMMLIENLANYKARARAIREKEDKS